MLGVSKKTSGFDPRSIPGCQLWLDGADTSTMTFSGQNVTQWNDKSGKTNTATTVGTLPYSSSSKSITFGGAGYFTLTNGYTMTNALDRTYTFFVVEKRGSANNTQFILAGGGTTSGAAGVVFGYNTNTTARHTTIINTDLDYTIAGFANPDPIRMWGGGYSGSLRDTYLNGSLAVSQAFSTPLTAWTTPCIGFIPFSSINTYYTGQIYEILFFDSYLTSTQRQQIEGYLAWKWGILLPASSIVPKSIPGCSLWLDGNDITTMFQDTSGTTPVTANGQTVARWKDKSSNGFTFITGTGGTAPTYNTSALNSLPGVTFGSVEQSTTFSTNFKWLDSASPINCYNSFTLGGSNTTIFAVVNVNAVNQRNTLFRTSINLDMEVLYPWTGVGFIWDQPYNSANNRLSVGYSVTGGQLISLVRSGATMTGYSNGESFATLSTASGTLTNSTATLSIGGGFVSSTYSTFNSNICEMLIYNRDLTSTQRQQVEGYLASKWGFPLSYRQGWTRNLSNFTESPVNTFIKSTASSSWGDSMVYSTQAMTGPFSFTVQVTERCWINMNTLPATMGGAGSYWFWNIQPVVNYSATTDPLTSVTGTANTSDLFTITSTDGVNVSFYKNGTFMRTSALQISTPFYFAFTCYGATANSTVVLTNFSYNLYPTHLFGNRLPFSRIFKPTDITGCTLWLDAADMSKYVPVYSTGTVSYPFGVAADSSGNVYVGQGNGAVRKITSSGSLSTLATMTGALRGAAVDSSGNVYVSDYNNNKIMKVTQSGVVTTFAGSGTQGYSGDGGAATSAWLNKPTGLVFNSSGDLFFADSGNNAIRKITVSTGIISTFATGFNFPMGIGVDSSGNFYVGNYMDQTIKKITSGGTVSTFAGSGTAGFNDATGTSAVFNYPSGIAVDSSGNVYVGDETNQRIRKITPSAVVTTFAGTGGTGSNEGAGTSATFNYPEGIAIDSSGNIYVADYANQRIRKITTGAVVSTFAGTGTSGSTDSGVTGATSLLDKSPSGYSTTAFTSTSGYPAAATSFQNKNNAIQFVAGSGYSIPSFVASPVISVFLVYYPNGQSTSGPTIEQGANATTTAGFLVQSQTPNFVIYSGSAATLTGTNTTTLNTWKILSAENPDPGSSTSNMSFYSNATLSANNVTQAGTTPVTSTLYINGRGGTSTNSYASYMGEVIVYNAALTASQRTQVEGYLAYKWGLMASIPSTHTFAKVYSSTVV